MNELSAPMESPLATSLETLLSELEMQLPEVKLGSPALPTPTELFDSLTAAW